MESLARHIFDCSSIETTSTSDTTAILSNSKKNCRNCIMLNSSVIFLRYFLCLWKLNLTVEPTLRKRVRISTASALIWLKFQICLFLFILFCGKIFLQKYFISGFALLYLFLAELYFALLVQDCLVLLGIYKMLWFLISECLFVINFNFLHHQTVHLILGF